MRYYVGQGDRECGQTGRLLTISVWTGSTARVRSSAAKRQRLMPGCAFAVNLTIAGSRPKGGRTGQMNRMELVQEIRTMISPAVFLRLGTKEVTTLNWGNRNLPPGFFRASLAVPKHTSALFIELILLHKY